jgi:hypothetical protein
VAVVEAMKVRDEETTLRVGKRRADLAKIREAGVNEYPRGRRSAPVAQILEITRSVR